MTDPRDPKSELLQTLTNVEAQATAHEALAQDLARAARLMREFTVPLKEIYSVVPSTALTADQWAQQTERWKGVQWAGQRVNEARPLLQLYTATSTTAMSTYTLSGIPAEVVSRVPQQDLPKMEAANLQLRRILERSTMVDQARSSMLRLGLNAGFLRNSTCVQLLDEAVGALERPVAEHGGSGSVLVTLRECIDRALADLLRRRPKQEQAPKVADKVRSIGKQCGLEGLNPGHFEGLALDASDLHRKLSGAKQSAMQREEISKLFHEGALFLSALLSSIDENCLKQ